MNVSMRRMKVQNWVILGQIGPGDMPIQGCLGLGKGAKLAQMDAYTRRWKWMAWNCPWGNLIQQNQEVKCNKVLSF